MNEKYCQYCEDSLRAHKQDLCEYYATLGYVRIVPLLLSIKYIEDYPKCKRLIKEEKDNGVYNYFIPQWLDIILKKYTWLLSNPAYYTFAATPFLQKAVALDQDRKCIDTLAALLKLGGLTAFIEYVNSVSSL